MILLIAFPACKRDVGCNLALNASGEYKVQIRAWYSDSRGVKKDTAYSDVVNVDVSAEKKQIHISKIGTYSSYGEFEKVVGFVYGQDCFKVEEQGTWLNPSGKKNNCVREIDCGNWNYTLKVKNGSIYVYYNDGVGGSGGRSYMSTSAIGIKKIKRLQ